MMKERLTWIDNAKGIGIILVVLGHTYGIPWQLHHIIYSFHMPLFFLLSGYTFSCSKTIQLLKKKGTLACIRSLAQAYLVPYFVLAGLNLCGNLLYELYCGSFSLIQQLRYIAGIQYCYASMTWMPMCSPIWFLPSIFLTKAIYTALFLRLSRKQQHIAAVVFALLAYGSSVMNVPRLPWNFLPSLFGIFFFHIGTVLRQKEILTHIRGTRKRLLLLISAAMLCLPLAAENLVGMNENTYGNPAVFLLTSLLYSVLVMAVSSNRKGLLTWFGENSIIFMGFNYLMRAYMVEIYYFIPFVRNYPIHWTVYFGMILLSLMAITLFYQKCFLPRYRKKVAAYEKN